MRCAVGSRTLELPWRLPLPSVWPALQPRPPFQGPCWRPARAHVFEIHSDMAEGIPDTASRIPRRSQGVRICKYLVLHLTHHQSATVDYCAMQLFHRSLCVLCRNQASQTCGIRAQTLLQRKRAACLFGLHFHERKAARRPPLLAMHVEHVLTSLDFSHWDEQLDQGIPASQHIPTQLHQPTNASKGCQSTAHLDIMPYSVNCGPKLPTNSVFSLCSGRNSVRGLDECPPLPPRALAPLPPTPPPR